MTLFSSMERMVNSVEIPQFSWFYCYRCECINIVVISDNAVNVHPLANNACAKIASIISQSQRTGETPVKNKRIRSRVMGNGRNARRQGKNRKRRS